MKKICSRKVVETFVKNLNGKFKHKCRDAFLVELILMALDNVEKGNNKSRMTYELRASFGDSKAALYATYELFRILGTTSLEDSSNLAAAFEEEYARPIVFVADLPLDIVVTLSSKNEHVEVRTSKIELWWDSEDDFCTMELVVGKDSGGDPVCKYIKRKGDNFTFENCHYTKCVIKHTGAPHEK